jgi:hypothetical protein
LLTWRRADTPHYGGITRKRQKERERERERERTRREVSYIMEMVSIVASN